MHKKKRVVETEGAAYTREDNNPRGYSTWWQKDIGQDNINGSSSHVEPWKKEQRDIKEEG